MDALLPSLRFHRTCWKRGFVRFEIEHHIISITFGAVAVVIVSCAMSTNCDQGGKRTFSRGTEKRSFGSRFKTTLRLCSSRSAGALRAASPPVD
jgi:hypothetical protein